MNKKYALGGITGILAMIMAFTGSAANAAIVSATGSGTLVNVNDSISGTFDLGTDTVDYTLTLNNISGIPGVSWNGASNADGSPNSGLSFNAGIPELTPIYIYYF